jgi:hypothetical protein
LSKESARSSGPIPAGPSNRSARQTKGERMTNPTPALDPKRTALLVMDFQQGVVQRMPGLEPLLGRVQRAKGT